MRTIPRSTSHCRRMNSKVPTREARQVRAGVTLLARLRVHHKVDLATRGGWRVSCADVEGGRGWYGSRNAETTFGRACSGSECTK